MSPGPQTYHVEYEEEAESESENYSIVVGEEEEEEEEANENVDGVNVILDYIRHHNEIDFVSVAFRATTLKEIEEWDYSYPCEIAVGTSSNGPHDIGSPSSVMKLMTEIDSSQDLPVTLEHLAWELNNLSHRPGQTLIYAHLATRKDNPWITSATTTDRVIPTATVLFFLQRDAQRSAVILPVWFTDDSYYDTIESWVIPKDEDELWFPSTERNNT